MDFNNGVVVQWGRLVMTIGQTRQIVSLPISFSNTQYTIFCIDRFGNAPSQVNQITAFAMVTDSQYYTTSKFTVITNHNNVQDFWMVWCWLLIIESVYNGEDLILQLQIIH